ncbi:MAG: M48 family metallopeptidase [Kiloniellales bacterium]|nr:M48 family metallopeptidase [Kiloniellales bacterium]
MSSADAAAVGLSRTDFYAAIRRNERNTFWLCLVMLSIGGLVGYVLGWAAEFIDRGGAGRDAALSPWELFIAPSAWGLGAAGVMTLLSVIWILVALLFGDRILLGMTGAEEVTQEAEPQLHNVVEEMAIAAGLPKPRVFVIETPALNAFAAGLKPEKSAVAVTRGLLDKLQRRELQGVVAHEMSHIANNDVLYATAIGVVVGLIALVTDTVFRGFRYGRIGRSRRRGKGGGGAVALVMLVVLAVAILAPLAAKLVQMAISREREYLADATAVKLTRSPLGLIGALEKIDGSAERFEGANRAVQHLFIANPLRKFSERSTALFSTHPPMPERIARLRNLG